jgi:hypothetical protein
VAWIEDLLGFEMIAGERAELYGYKEFSAEDILSRTDEFAIIAARATAAMPIANPRL